MAISNTEIDINSCTTSVDNSFSSSSLPPEILVNIFSFFSDSAKDLLLCAQVSQAWHHIITSFYIWRKVKFNKFETFSRFHEILRSITRTRKNRALDNWRRFVKAYLNVDDDDDCENDVGIPISFTKPAYFYSTKFYGHFVKELDLSEILRKSHVTEEMLCNLFPNIPNLENVNFSNCYNVTDKVIEKLTKSCHHLRKLKLFGCTSLTNKSLYWVEMRCPELITLNIGFCTIITSIALQSLINKCEKLTSLTSSYCSNTPAISLIQMVKKLQKLYMRNSFTSDLIVKNIISQIPSLRKLDLGSSTPKLCDETTEIISRHCPNLVHLSLPFSLITSQGLNKIAKGCKKLLFIDLSGCHLIDDGISNFLSYCTELKIIYLNYLQISGKSFSSIIKSNHIEYASFTCSKILEVSTISPSFNEEKSRIKKLLLNCCEISDNNLKEISYWCKNLEYLDISCVCDIDDHILQYLSDNLENLKRVIAKDCYGVSISMQDNLSKHQKINFTFYGNEEKKIED